MALTNCNECDREISRKAKTCPNCGAPIKKNDTASGLLLVAILFGLFLYWGDDAPSEDELEEQYKLARGLPAQQVCENAFEYKKLLNMSEEADASKFITIAKNKVTFYSEKCDAENAPNLSKSAAPPYAIVKQEDLSYGGIRRVQYRIQLPEHYPSTVVEAIARQIVGDLRKKSNVVNTVSMLFYGPNSSTDGAYDIASIDWAPNGEWSEAGRASDYSSFQLKISYNEPYSTNVRLLTASDTTGLFGIPLPHGSHLTKRTAAAKHAGIDAREQYELDEPAEEILMFFISEMPRAGWKKTGPYSESVLFFEKDGIGSAVLVNKDGGTFTLMGS